MPRTAAEIAGQLQGEVVGDGSVVLTGFAPANTAKAGDLTFAENQAYFDAAEKSAATAILVPAEFSSARKVLIRVPNTRVAFAKVLPLFFPEPAFAPGIHPGASIAPSAKIDPTAHIGPGCVIGEEVKIGAHAALLGGNHIAAHCEIGAETKLFPNVVLYPRTRLGQRVILHAGVVIGSDGFGYVFDTSFHRKVSQIGNVVIHDDVEIGANTTVDRGALGSTVIGRGTKIDNLVQIGHNVIIGEHCIIVAQVGIAGSTKIGNYVTIAGQAGLSGHLKVGDRVTIAAQSGVIHDVPAGEKWLGNPAIPDRQAKRQYIGIQRLPDLIRRVNELERQLGKPAPPEQK